MNILVTGSAGFIASHIIEKLLKDKTNIVIGIDNFYSGFKKNIEFLKYIDKYNNFTFIEADIRDFECINDIMKKNAILQVYHLAAIVSVQESIQHPLLSNDVNVKGTLNVLEASRKNNVKRIVFSSSAAVYGDEPTQPKNENSIVKPISPYGVEKLVGEHYMNLYNNLYGIETIILRYFNVYGERQNAMSEYSGVISIFDKKFKNNESVNIYGDGEQYRDFINVKDVADINIKIMNSRFVSHGLFCVGTFTKVSINNLLNIMNRKYNKNIKVNYLTQREGDIKESICDNRKIVDLLKIKRLKIFEEEIKKL